MNKEGFNQLISDYSKADLKFQELEDLVDRYPYSQALRLLNVQSSNKLSKVEFQKRLGLAAFYSTDRNVLRSLIEHGQVPSDLVKQVPKNKKVAPVASKTKKVVKQVKSSLPKPKQSIEKLREEVLFNLDQLQKSKSHFLEITGEGNMDLASSKPVKKAQKEEIEAVSTQPTEKMPVAKSKPAKVTATKPSLGSSIKKRSKKSEIIDKFIAKEPSITPNKKPLENQSDLSKASSILKEDLVSENLAVIFANQGKTSKAIEIYKKLIWKFPQKKASFAARIEELKKKK